MSVRTLISTNIPLQGVTGLDVMLVDVVGLDVVVVGLGVVGVDVAGLDVVVVGLDVAGFGVVAWR